jgi:hypothetical protein
MSASMRKLPGYARHVDRTRLVRILCRGTCRMTRWAEMNAPYPGKDVLKRARLGQFRATCLQCGYVAVDNYNWFR